MSGLPDYAPGGSPDELRETIAELMATVGMRAQMAVNYASIADDVGLAYSLRCATAEFRAALAVAGMLVEATEPERARRRAAHSHHHPAEVCA